MSLSNWDRQHLNRQQQQAVETYTAQWERAKREGDEDGMRRAHAGAETIRWRAGYSGGEAGETFRPTTEIKKDTRTGAAGYDNGGLERGQVKAIQKALGVDQDGYFGPKTQEAAFQRWGASDANSALKAFLTNKTPARESLDLDEDEGVFTYGGKTYTTKADLTAAMNAANLSAAEKNILNRKATSSGSGVKLTAGKFTGEDPATKPDVKESTANGKTETALATAKGVLARKRAELQRADRGGTVAQRKQLREDIKLLEAEIKRLTPSKDDGFSAGKLAADTVRKGVTTAASGMSSTLAWLENALFSPVEALTGFDDLNETHGLFHRWNESIQAERDTAYNRAEENIAKGGTAAKIADTVGTATVAAIPQAVTAFMSLGASLGLAGAQGLEATALAAQQSPTLLNALRGAVVGMANNPNYWSSFLQTAGNSYDEAKADGATDAKASLFALTNGLANAAIEVGGGLETLPAELQNGPLTFKRWLKSAAEEGGEEVWQGIIERALQNVTYGKNNPVASMTNENAVLNPVTAAKEFGTGAAVGGILGGGQAALAGAINNVQQQVTAQQFAEAYREQVNPDASVGEILAQYDRFIEDTTPPKTINFRGLDMTLDDLRDYTKRTAERLGIKQISEDRLRAAFNTEYERQHGGANENAVSKAETANQTDAPAQDAGLRGNPISEPSGQSPGQTATREGKNSIFAPEELVNEKSAARIQKEHGDQAYVEAFTEAMNAGDVKLDATGKPFVPQAESHIDNRDRHDVGNRRVKAFQFENPEIHPFYAKVAEALMDELNTAQKGGELVVRGNFSDAGGQEFRRTKRSASKAISELRDDYGFSYADIEKALKAIIADEGQENIAVAKRLELLIDELLENDYVSAWGPISDFVDINAYRDAKAAIRGAQEQTAAPRHEVGSWEAYRAENRLALETGEMTENELRAEWEQQNAAPAVSTRGSEPETRRTVSDERNLTENNDSVGAARAAFTPEQVQSRDSSTASALNEDERQMEGLRPEDATHQKLTNAESLAHARERLELDYDGEVADLPNIRDWGAVEMDMAQMILRDKVEAARETGDYSDVVKWKGLIDERKSTTGQALQANRKYAGDPASIVSTAAETLEGSKLPKAKKAEVLNTISRQADKLGSIKDGDTASLAELVKENSTIRKTNSLIGNKLSSTLEKLIDGDSSDHLRLVAQAQLESMASDYVPRSMGNKARSLRTMAMLSNLATVTRNLVSNNVFDPIDSLANDVGVPVDMLLARFTGTRSTALDGSWFSKVKRQASAEALARSAIEVALDVDTDAEGGTNRYGQSSKRTYKMTGSTADRLLSTWAKWQGYLLNSTDEFQKGGIEAETQRGVDALKQQGKVKDDSLDTAGAEMAKYRTFQDDTRLSQGVGMIHDAGNKFVGTADGEFGLGDVVIPFSRVPANLVGRVWDYSPAGVAKGLFDLATTLKAAHDGSLTAEQQAKAVRELGRGATGTALIAGLVYLAKEGLLHVAGDDEDKDKAALDAAEGKTGIQLNLDATLRHLKGESSDWEQGDTLISMGSIDPVSALMMIGALIAEDMDENGLTAKGAAKASTYGTLQTILDLPGMNTLERMANDYKYSDEATIGGKIKDAALGAAADLPNSYVPNALKAVARGTDNAYRDLYTSGTLAGETRDELLGAIPGARKNLPEKVDPFGRTKTYTDNDVLNFLNATILPGAVTPNKQDDLSAELERLYKATGDAGMYPNRSAPKSLTKDGKEVELTTEQRDHYQRAYGTTAHDLMDAARTSDAYGRLDDTGKVALLSKCLGYAADTAKQQLLGTELSTADANARDAQKLYGISTTDYLAAKTATAGISGNVKDPTSKKGEGIENSQSLLLMQAIYNTGVTDGLREKQRKELFQSLGVNKTTCGYSAKMVENKLKAMERKYGLELVS